jgi:hypothetical protein
MEIDKMFGSAKFKLRSDLGVLHDSARLILNNPINATTFNQRAFMQKSTDIIAIERTLSERMKRKFLPPRVTTINSTASS